MMKNKEEEKTFLNFLISQGDLVPEQYEPFRHFMDMELRDLLKKIGIFSEEHMRFMWSKYIHEKKFNFGREKK
jgi:hypothetical protein